MLIKNSIQNWLPIEKIEKKGFIKTKEEKWIKIIKITPIHYVLKTELEKQAIIMNYKRFLKICSFEIQIIIQSQREDFNKYLQSIKENCKQEEKKTQKLAEQYYEDIIQLNQFKKFSSKKFFILIKNPKEIQENNPDEKQMQCLQEKYDQIKEGLFRCGNKVEEVKEREEAIEIISSFLKKEGGEERY